MIPVPAMKNKPRHLFSAMSGRTALFSIVILAALTALIGMTVTVTITGSYEGVFLLRGEHGALFELKDDLYLGEGYRYMAGIDLVRMKQFFFTLAHAGTPKDPFLYYEWNEKKGEGYVRNYLPGGRQMLTCFSRYRDDWNRETSGLFVGGGLPANAAGHSTIEQNETGMAYYDGKRWFHVWCNANEMIFNARKEPLYPSSWRFLGSRVLHDNEQDLVLESDHEVTVDGVPLHISKHAYFRAGDPYFLLAINVRNIGMQAVTYSYLYADEPWLGNFGSSGGNVGWSAEGLYQYVGVVNTKRTRYAGFFDYGNDAIGEGHDYTLLANFLEWLGPQEPFVYFTNGPTVSPLVGNAKIPLSGNSRYIGVEWGRRDLHPGGSETYRLAIGMAGSDGLPVKPALNLGYYP